jgi:hypothetical protein
MSYIALRVTLTGTRRRANSGWWRDRLALIFARRGGVKG